MKPLTTLVFVSACLALATSSIAGETIRPNVLFLISDDLGSFVRQSTRRSLIPARLQSFNRASGRRI